jgi:hypothetical protein
LFECVSVDFFKDVILAGVAGENPIQAWASPKRSTQRAPQRRNKRLTIWARSKEASELTEF